MTATYDELRARQQERLGELMPEMLAASTSGMISLRRCAGAACVSCSA